MRRAISRRRSLVLRALSSTGKSGGLAQSKLSIEDMIPLGNKRGSVSRSALAALLAISSLPLICAGREDVLGKAESPGQPHANAASVAAASLRCPLQEGVTTFVVQVPKGGDCLTFINENAAVRGELKISVSNDKLAANDPRWTSVGGTTLFNHKRLFNLSMVGVEANYVKLSFHVEKSDRVAALGW
jgi:hypothetical protein